MDWKEMLDFSTYNPEALDAEIVRDFLNAEENLPTKNYFSRRERDMLFKLKLFKMEFGLDTDQIADVFMALQLSYKGFNRLSLERLMARQGQEHEDEPNDS